MHRVFLTLTILAVVTPSFATDPNPSPRIVCDELRIIAHEYRIPSVLLMGVAWHGSRLQQFDRVTGKPTETKPGRVGVLSVPVENRADANRLYADWRYNVREGAKLLVHAWNRAPLPGTSRLEAGRNIIEAWFPATGWYGTGGRGGFRGREGASADAYAHAVLDAVATGGNGLWEPVRVSRPSPEALAWGRNLLCPPTPWHYGDVPTLPPATVVANLNVPYLSQAWDVPDGFDGSGSCGPCAIVMVEGFAGKRAAPVMVSESYPHVSAWGALVPPVQAVVCEPGRGAIHAKMLAYLRPLFSGVAIFYDEKATRDRVTAELRAGRPVILGTSVTPAGHLMVARGYLSDGKRIIVNDPAGDREQLARLNSPTGAYSPTGSRYWNGGGAGAIYDWDVLDVRWIMTLGDAMPPKDADRAEDEE